MLRSFRRKAGLALTKSNHILCRSGGGLQQLWRFREGALIHFSVEILPSHIHIVPQYYSKILIRSPKIENRDLIMQLTSLTGDQMNIITFCMTAVSLVGAVMQLAKLSGPGTEDLYREYLGKLACCHFSLVSL